MVRHVWFHRAIRESNGVCSLNIEQYCFNERLGEKASMHASFMTYHILKKVLVYNYVSV